MIMVGLIVTVVGLGDKGFLSIELKLIGPITVVCGGILSCVRILACTKTCRQCSEMCRNSKEVQSDNQILARQAIERPGRGGVQFEHREVEIRYGQNNQKKYVAAGMKDGGWRQVIQPVRLAHGDTRAEDSLPHKSNTGVKLGTDKLQEWGGDAWAD